MRVRIRNIVLLFICFISNHISIAQNSQIDSLIAISKTSASDSNQVKRYFQISSKCLKEGNNIGVHKYASLARDLCITLHDRKGEATAYNFIGVAFKEMGNYPMAFENYFKGLKIAEELNLEKLKLNLYDNLGNLYAQQGEQDKAIDYFNRALANLKGKNNDRILQTYNNLAVSMAEKGDLVSAQNYFQKVYDIALNKGDTFNMEGPIGNIGNIYELKGDNNKALELFNEALLLSYHLGDKNKIALWLESIGSLHLKQNNLKDAEHYLLQSMAISDTIGAMDMISINAHQLSNLYERTNKHELALKYYQQYVNAQDSIFNSVNSNKMIQIEMNYEFDNMVAEEKIQIEKKNALAEEEHKKNNLIIFTSLVFLILCIGFAIYIYKSYKAKQKANMELTEQKNIIEEKQNEILASIHYAKRIQSALLTNENYFERTLNKLSNRNEK